MTTMRFPLSEAQHLQDTQESSMFDRCVIYRYGDGVVNEYGEQTAVWTPDDESVECSFRAAKPLESTSNRTTVQLDAQIRLPAYTTLDERDRVEVTHIHGEELAETILMGVVGNPKRSRTGLLAYLTRVTSTTDEAV